MLVQDAVHELLDLVAVHGFYISVLEEKLGHPIPLPNEAITPDRSKAEHSIEILHRWLAVLDFAIPPITVRDALKESLPRETAEAMLRYFIGKSSHEETDRDKADCVATFLYRSSDLGSKPIPQTSDRYHFISEVAREFEGFICKTLGDTRIPEIKKEHEQLLKEFEYLHQEVDDFRTFDQLMDSGIVQRVRDIKQSFNTSFYVPSVLANVAVYNTIFGARFDKLFHATTEQIKSFATKVQDEGASIMSRLDEDVTVKHLADVEGSHIMNQEYGKAQENFRKISKFKKVVDKKGGRPSGRPGGIQIVPDIAVRSSPPPSFSALAAAAATAKASSGSGLQASYSAVSGTNVVEEGKLRSQQDAIRIFVRVADKSCFVVPLVKGVVNITAAEAEALRSDFGSEKSFRADYASIISMMVAMVARLVVEQEDFRAKQSSAYLWKPHADAIAYIISSATGVLATANQILEMAEKRGLEEKVTGIKATIVKLRMALQQAATTLKSAGTQNA
ncbi:MAG: hypothetical protein JWO20_1920 [Candidatus Angelobacter sp.]|nr:hypothetical protein [Candidatus Angelobacter sp.]